MNCLKLVGSAVVAACAMFATAAMASQIFYVSDLELRVKQGWGEPHRNLSVDGNPLYLAGQKYEHGLGTHANSVMRIGLDGNAESFSADVGVDGDESVDGTVTFMVVGDGRKLFETPVMRGGEPARHVSVDLHGIKTLTLVVGDAGDGIDHDHADWADAKIVMASGKPVTLDPEGGEPLPAASFKVTNTPVAFVPAVIHEEPVPAIHGAKVFGVRPGNQFLFTIAATGDRPMTFSVDDLPEGLQVDAQTGQITGILKEAGEHTVTLHAKNAAGSAERKLKIICGPVICLTPAMGWNSWNCFGGAVTAEKVRAAADAMVSSGLSHHGWTYINIDDYWEQNPKRMTNDPSLGGPGRDADGNIVPNPRFPDMKALVDHIHGLGLKAGIYSSPGPLTCGGCLASWKHEQQDALQYAAWGIDYLKYDWCSYGSVAPRETNKIAVPAGEPRWRHEHSLEALQKPYRDMRAALDKTPRDIVFSLCQYGMGDVWTWGGDVGGNCWRTSDDITDNWRSLSGNGFRLGGHENYVGPGRFDDPDMMVLGWVDVGSGMHLHPTRLTHDEQCTHMSLWCLLASPLLLGCDLNKLDDFTLSLLTNDEVLDVDQDPLGRQASPVSRDVDRQVEVWAKDMEDGSKAVGLFNRGPAETNVVVNWSDLKITGSQTVRDLWKHQDLGKFEGSFTTSVPSHGVVLVKISPAQ